MSKNTRITVKVRREYKKEFMSWMKRFGISKDRFLATQLPKELFYLKQLPRNSPKGKQIEKTLLAHKDAERLSISLPVSTAEEISAVCESIGVSRDAFIDMYLDFLLNGDEQFGSCGSPLAKIAAMLEDPRFEYACVDGNNPYDDLIWTDESVEEFLKMFDRGERRSLKKGMSRDRR